MKHIMDGSGHPFNNCKRAMMFGGQFACLIREGQVLCLQPDLVSFTELVFRYSSSPSVQGGLSLSLLLFGLGHFVLHSFVLYDRRCNWVQNWVVPQQHLCWGYLGGGVGMVVVDCCCQWEPE